jgi:hypothetical protein
MHFRGLQTFYPHIQSAIRIRSGLLILLSMAFNLPSLTGDELRWKFAPGQRYQAEVTYISNILNEYETRSSDLSTETRIEISWEVRQFDAGVALIEQKIERIVLQLDTPTTDGTGKIFFDSGNLSGSLNLKPELQTQLKSLVGATFMVRMRENGAVESAECSPEALTALRSVPMSSGVRDLLSPEGLGKLFSDSTFVFPVDETTAKEGWNVSEAKKSRWGDLQIETSYVLAGEEPFESRPHLKFTSERKLRLIAQKSDAEPASVAEQNKLEQEAGTGVWYFDPAEGYFTSGKTSLQIKTDRTYREETMKTTYRTNSTFRMRKLN